MREKLILLVSVTTLFISCSQIKKKESLSAITKTEVSVNNSTNEAYTLMKNNCYVCHNPKTVSHDSLLAPPFVAVKRHYSMQYTNKKDFVDAIVNWVQNPEEDKALMFGAVKRFKVMPKLPLETTQLQKIAAYLYDNDIEQPKWFEEHFNEMHGNGNGMRGKGKKMKNN